MECVKLDRGRHNQRPSTPQPLANLFDDCFFVRELAGGEFRVDQLAIDGQFETASAGGFEFHPCDFLLVTAQDFFRQTDGLWLVVSSGAVPKVDLHDVIPSYSELLGEKTDARRRSPQSVSLQGDRSGRAHHVVRISEIARSRQ